MTSITAFYPIISVTSNSLKWMDIAKWPNAPAYHAPLPWQALLVAGACAVMIAFITIVLHRLTPAETTTPKKERIPGNLSEAFQYA